MKCLNCTLSLAECLCVKLDRFFRQNGYLKTPGASAKDELKDFKASIECLKKQYVKISRRQ